MNNFKGAGKYGFVLVLVLILTSCSSRVKTWYATADDIEMPVEKVQQAPLKASALTRRTGCYDTQYYIPDTNHIDHTPIKYIRVNFHFVNAQDSARNWPQERAMEFAKGILHAANYDLAKNRKMFMPLDNETPVIPIRIRYQLTPDSSMPGDSGVYRHFDDELCYHVQRGKNATLYKREVIRKYEVKGDSILNFFVMPHHPDSVASKTYRTTISGVALGRSIKLTGLYEHGPNFWRYRGIVNHEVGHVLGLSHAWTRNDGCDDTPPHANQCWGKSEEPPCDTQASNNVMDYNAYQHAWTPCQIGRVHYRMSHEKNSVRKLLVPNWCERNPEQDIVIRDSVVWQGAKDLEGNLTIAAGGHLTIHCRVSIPADGKITIEPGGVLTLNNGRLHNACDKSWQGIEIQQQGRLKGRVVLIGEPQLEQMERELERTEAGAS